MSHHTHSSVVRRRTGFTLTELLVVMAILTALAALTALTLPSFNLQARSSQGASDLQNWLLLARQTAVRDQAPRGVRIYVDQTTLFASKAQYIEQPDDFNGGALVSSVGVNGNTNPDPQYLTLVGADPTGGFYDPNNTSDQTLYPVQNGDSIQLHNSGLMHQIIGIAPDPNVNGAWQFKLYSPLGAVITSPQKNYKIVRRPRLQGDEPMTMPNKIGIDLNTNSTYQKQPLSLNTVDSSIDIMFSPTGTVMGFAGVDKLYFWVRDIGFEDRFAGNPTLIVVYVQSGLVAGYDLESPAPGVGTPNPYARVK